MNAINDILARLPMDQLASQLGTDEATARQAASQAVSSLVGGMQHNASNEQGAQSLAGALRQHSESPFINTDRVDLDQVDTKDGEKIVGHVLGNDDEAQVQALTGGGGGLLNNPQAKQLLRVLAPIVLGYIAGQATSGKGGNILNDILGGGNQGGNATLPPQQPTPETKEEGRSGGILGDLLGGLFGKK